MFFKWVDYSASISVRHFNNATDNWPKIPYHNALKSLITMDKSVNEFYFLIFSSIRVLYVRVLFI